MVIFPQGKKVGFCRFLSNCVMLTVLYIPPGFPHLYPPCGKTCGDCGKVRVFNRYLMVFQLSFYAAGYVYTPVYPREISPSESNYATGIYTSLFWIFCLKNWQLGKTCRFSRVCVPLGQHIFCGTFTNFFSV